MTDSSMNKVYFYALVLRDFYCGNEVAIPCNNYGTANFAFDAKIRNIKAKHEVYSFLLKYGFPSVRIYSSVSQFSLFNLKF